MPKTNNYSHSGGQFQNVNIFYHSQICSLIIFNAWKTKLQQIIFKLVLHLYENAILVSVLIEINDF